MWFSLFNYFPQILMLFKFNGICTRFSASAGFLKILFLLNYSLHSRPFCISFRCTAQWPENMFFTERSLQCFKHLPGPIHSYFFSLFKIVKHYTHIEKGIRYHWRAWWIIMKRTPSMRNKICYSLRHHLPHCFLQILLLSILS